MQINSGLRKQLLKIDDQPANARRQML